MSITLDYELFFKLGIVVTIILGIIIIFNYFKKLIVYLTEQFIPYQSRKFYSEVIKPDLGFLTLIWFLSLGDIALLINNFPPPVKVSEIILSLVISILTIWLGVKWFKPLFDNYLLDAALQSQKKINSEFLIVGKYSANAIIFLLIIFIFAQVHSINLFGLLASLGIGGLAVAFAAQKTLEQLLGGVVIYLDRPFVLDDYIGLPDGTFGRVESIGLRSTKIRVSGKGTLMVIPNSSLTQTNIENFTGAKKVISLVYLTFYSTLELDEMALIRQIILDSTKDIFGIDPKNTEVKFKQVNKNERKEFSQAQISFFLLGSEQVSMDLRRQLLNIANQNIRQKLEEYGIDFTLEDDSINVDSPITI
ncbi:mechanosensitive ion channel family protein [Cyanobacterium sp. Dongsha4]|uniref:mechanosensitive ion channel family protein n=1 Tax=Cyanobacterium sp. DS4 TaxID=2878255 RepID=UPI002E8242B9|nr:mechanosensitive ion channel domain-containing protein [Cyanobacterium sp. Dongsha4]WVL00323.1 mechanosensitive ion channel family protein [Cyanobacterium sp. Dongsha4]